MNLLRTKIRSGPLARGTPLWPPRPLYSAGEGGGEGGFAYHTLSTPGRPHPSPLPEYRARGPERRGTAEIELLIGMSVLIAILLLTRSALRFGLARFDAAESVERLVFEDATANTPPQLDDGTVDPVIGYSNLRPGLPNRVHVSQEQRTVTIYGGQNDPLPPTNVMSKAALPSPPWTFSGYSAGQEDIDATRAWFLTYVAESHEELILPLGMAPAWRP